MTENRRTEIQGEITALKDLLAESDYTMLKAFEGILNCTSATEISNYVKKMAPDVIAKHVERQTWRDKINALETELAEDDPVETAEPVVETHEATETAAPAEGAAE